VYVIPNQPATGGTAQSAAHPPFSLKIYNISFESNHYEKHISLDMIIGPRIDMPKTPRPRNAQTPTMNGVPPPTPQQQKAEEEKWEEPRIVYERATIPSEPVNAFGIPQATMRCLEVRELPRGLAENQVSQSQWCDPRQLAESVSTMSELIQYSTEQHLGPLGESLSR